MRKARGNLESPGVDGWIRLAPGATFAFHVDTPISPSLDELRKWMADIRGGVLSLSFGIENELVLLALAHEFGSNNSGAVKPDYSLREREWREEHNLKRKIERAKPIIRARRTSDEADTIIQRLAEYRELRNLLAHYPSWLEPVNREGVADLDKQRTIALKLFIADQNYVWEVDAAQATEWHALMLFVRVAVENIRREMIGAPLLNADGTLPEQKMPEPAPPRGTSIEHKLQHGRVSQLVFPKA